MPADARQLRGQQIADTCRLTRKGDDWIVPSQSGNGKYTVSMAGQYPTCTCPDYETNLNRCKHLYAVEFTVRREENPDGTTTETRSVTVTETVRRPTYKQDWPNYDKAATREKHHFQELLADLCATIPEPQRENPTKGGRPPVPLRDAVYLTVFKVYCGFSARRFMCDVQDTHERGHILKPVSYPSVVKAMERDDLTPILVDMIQKSAAPLAEAESQFAVDSSGFCLNTYTRWIDLKYGVPRKEHKWVKVHITTGCRTNCVTAAEIHDPNTNDWNILPSLVNTTARRFTLSEVSADKAYAANPNFDAVARHGGTLYAAFRKNTTGGVGGLYEKMFHTFCANREDYLKHYHRRSNVESTFSAVKRKFGKDVRCKTETACKNEVYAKMICQNVCCLISAMYELGLTPPTWLQDDDDAPVSIRFPGVG
jgi:hypothetical protein